MSREPAQPEDAQDAQSKTLGGSAWKVLALDCCLATAIRLVLAWSTPGYRYDVLTFESWARTLRGQPLDRFYATATRPDHLPGDLWLLKVIEWLYTWLGGHDLGGPTFALLTQVIPTLGDLLTGLMIFLIVRRVGGNGQAGRAARWYLLNPATILLTGVWGQWDSVSLGLTLTGLWLLTQSQRALWVMSAPFLAWALLIKPQMALAALCFLVLVWRHVTAGKPARVGRRRVVASLTAGTVWAFVGLATAYALLLPFGVHLLRAPRGEFTLLDRLSAAADQWPYTTMGAANIWMLPHGSVESMPDGQPGWLGVSPQSWGLILLLISVIVIVLGWSLRLRSFASVPSVAWAATATMFAWFMLSTRVHERYALPVLGLGLVYGALQGLGRGVAAWFWLLSMCLSLNLLMGLFSGLNFSGSHRVVFGSTWWLGLAMAYTLLFVPLLIRPWWTGRQAEVGVRSSTYPSSRPA